MRNYIDDETAKKWRLIADKWKQANCLLLDIRLELMRDIGVTSGKAMEKTNKAIRETAVSYEFTPQSEWMGGDSLDSDNFKYRPPHIMKWVKHED